jgi:phosphoglycerate dehydrogenase-like enzyme
MMGKNEFAMMKDGALFINTARGALVDHNALYEELKTGRLKACLDVYLETCSEPVKSRYRQLSNVLITPGIAGPTAQTLKEMGDTIVEDLRRFFAGEKPENRVDPKRLAIIA